MSSCLFQAQRNAFVVDTRPWSEGVDPAAEQHVQFDDHPEPTHGGVESFGSNCRYICHPNGDFTIEAWLPRPTQAQKLKQISDL